MSTYMFKGSNLHSNSKAMNDEQNINEIKRSYDKITMAVK